MTSYQKSDSVNQCLYLLQKQACQIPSSISIRFETAEPQAFLKRSPQQEQQEEDQLSSDMRSVPDLKEIEEYYLVT